MKLAADDIQDVMISKSQQLSNNKTDSSVPKHTADIAAKLRLSVQALEDSNKKRKMEVPAGKIKVPTYISMGGNYKEMIFLDDDATVEFPIIDNDVMKAFCNKSNKQTLNQAHKFLQASVLAAPPRVND